MKSLAFTMAFLGLLNLMMAVLATDLHTAQPTVSTTLITIPINKDEIPRQNVARDPPTPTPSTTPGPGQNVVDYNLRNPNFRIPPYVLLPRDGNILQDPSTGWPGGRDNPQAGGRALEVMFSADEVWTAFSQAWQHIRDASNAGGYYTSIPSFATVNQEFWNYAASHWPRWQAGQFFPSEVPSDIWDNIFDWAGWPDEAALANARVFLYPLTFQGHFDGGDSAPANSNERVIAPGEYRVVFTDTGTYLGVVRYRPGLPNAYGILLRTTPRTFLRASWLAPVDARQLSVAEQDATTGRWNYPGVPLWASQLPENFLPPLNVVFGAVLLQRWNRLAHPGGSRPPPRRDHGALYLPGADENNTDSAMNDTPGFYKFDANFTGENSTDLAAEKIRNLRCSNAVVAVNRTFQVSCESDQNQLTHTLDYHIAVTGIGLGGYHALGWCKGIMDNVKRYCNIWDVNVTGDVSCNTGNATLSTWFMDNRISRSEHGVDGNERTYGDYVNHVDGIEMWFTLRPPWDGTDNNHECIAKAIQQGSCVTQGMQPIYPVTCRSKNFVDLELNEWSWANLGDV